MVKVDDEWHQGMVNVGVRPTLDNGTQLSVEVNIFDFDGDIYGKPITLQFIKFLRPNSNSAASTNSAPNSPATATPPAKSSPP